MDDRTEKELKQYKDALHELEQCQIETTRQLEAQVDKYDMFQTETNKERAKWVDKCAKLQNENVELKTKYRARDSQCLGLVLILIVLLIIAGFVAYHIAPLCDLITRQKQECNQHDRIMVQKIKMDLCSALANGSTHNELFYSLASSECKKAAERN